MRAIGVFVAIIIAAALAYLVSLRVAPDIEASIGERTRVAVDAVATHPIEIVIDGRRAVLTGLADSPEQRRALLAAAAGVAGADVPVDRLEILPRADMYRFTAAFGPDGALRIAGFAPSAEAQEAIADAAQAAALRLAAMRSGEVAVVDELTLATGAPTDWPRRVGDGLAALSFLSAGVLTIEGAEVRLTGEAATEQAFATAQRRAEDLGADAALTLIRPTVAPFTLTVLGPGVEPTSEEAAALSSLSASARLLGPNPAVAGAQSWRIFGHAPDAQARARIVDSLRDAADAEPAAAIVLADGAPEDGWTDFVVATLQTLPLTDTPRLEINDAEALLSGQVDAPDAIETLRAAFEPGAPARFGTLALAVTTPPAPMTDPTPKAEPTPAARPARPAAASDGGAQDAVRDAGLDGAQDAAQEAARDAGQDAAQDAAQDTGRDAGQDAAQDAGQDAGRDAGQNVGRIAATPAASASGGASGGASNAMDAAPAPEGRRDAPQAAAPVVDAIGPAPGAQPTQPAPPPRQAPEPELKITLSPADGLRLEGVLPDGLDRDDALAALGAATALGELSEGGGGDASAWRRDLEALGELIGEFEQLDAVIAPGRARFAGQTLERSDPEQVRVLLDSGFSSRAPEIDVAPTPIAYPEGAERQNPITGRTEIRRRGYWLPEVTVDADDEGCRRASDLVLVTNEIRFRFDSVGLDVRARSVINELSAIALACLPASEDDRLQLASGAPAAAGPITALEIGGHTDSFGPDLYNLRLSDARAEAVRSALIARGMPASRLISRGYGEALPLVPNDSRANRRKNRRITFDWIRTQPAP